jgi:hypothetical protein
LAWTCSPTTESGVPKYASLIWVSDRIEREDAQRRRPGPPDACPSRQLPR